MPAVILQRQFLHGSAPARGRPLDFEISHSIYLGHFRGHADALTDLAIGGADHRSHKGVRDPRRLGRPSECECPADSHGCAG